MILRHEPESDRPVDVFRHYLGDLVYGANDGLVTTFTVVSGVTGARLAPSILVILGLVNLLADGFSMGASNFLAIRSSSGAEGVDRGFREPLMHGIATFLSFVLIGTIPLLAYLIPGATTHPFLVSSGLTAGALFGVGALRSLVVRDPWMKCGLEMLGVGSVAAAVAYGVGRALAPLIP
ncbi:MAG: VIT1/CCC1 transporter family protein [Planctomycetes bacterium]|nr:VIT1/CCC1 transporter family protein [Planctomycetota bacterium]